MDLTKTIAYLALVACAIGVVLGNYWFTFGLWPRSWGAFVFFALVQMAISAALQLVSKSDD